MGIYIYSTALALIFFLLTLHYVKKRRLDFQYCILWMVVSIIFVVFAVEPGLLSFISERIGVYYSPAFLFLTGILISFMLIFYLTLVISSMQRKLTRLTQEIGITKSKVEGQDAA
jgi:hypothetical protein